MTAKGAQKSKPESASFGTTVDVQIESDLWDAEPASEAIVRAAIAAAAALSTSPGEVSILLADDSVVRGLNKQWRGIDKPTNVLSFPAPKSTVNLPSPRHRSSRPLGDIVIAYEMLVGECADEGRQFIHHLSHLVVHGYLHLLGYDHQTDAEAEMMEALESKIMKRMGMPDPWSDPRLEDGPGMTRDSDRA
jgi:probable rRNA maturation factor